MQGASGGCGLAGSLGRLADGEDDEVAGIGADVDERGGEAEGRDLHHWVGDTTNVRAVVERVGQI